jgi:putative membrane protein
LNVELLIIIQNTMKKSFQEQVTIDALRNVSLFKAMIVIFLLSVLAFLFLVWLLYFKTTPDSVEAWVYQLPALNATFNSISTVLLLLGFREIKKRNFDRHMRFMLGAFATSTLFLASYVVYHNFIGHTPFPGQGFIRPVYFFILITHIILSAAVVPLILTSFFFAFSGKFQSHKKISRFTFPIWMYVSVTGVMIFFILNAYL